MSTCTSHNDCMCISYPVFAGAVELFTADRTRIRDAEEAIMRRRAVVSELELRTRAVTLQASQPTGQALRTANLRPLGIYTCALVHSPEF